jgi:hypothetical protein
LELADALGDRFEFASAARASDANSWQVADKVLIESTKGLHGEPRLFNRSQLSTDRASLGRARRWFDEEFDQLVGTSVSQAREDFLSQGRKLAA